MFKPSNNLNRASENVFASYRTKPEESYRDVAKEAYEIALASARETLKDDAVALSVIDGHNSIADFKREVDGAKEVFDGRRKDSKCARVLRTLSARILYYGNVLDVLAQHHPEYVALAWGAAKLVLIGILNYEKALTHFANALVEIGAALQGAQLSAELYKTTAMKEAISQVYVHVIAFLLQAIKWYSKSRLRRAADAVFNPAELEYQETVQQIRFHAEIVKGLLIGGTSVELRDIHLKIDSQEKTLESILLNMKAVEKTLAAKADKNLNATLSVSRTTSRMATQMDDMQPRIHDMHLLSIVRELNQKNESAFSKLQSFNNRSKTTAASFKDSPSFAQLMSCLKAWASMPVSVLFNVMVGPRAETRAREVIVETLTTGKEQGVNVIYALPEETSRQQSDDSSLVPLFKTLIAQGVQKFPDVINNPQTQIHAATFAADRTEAEWASTFYEVFTSIDHCFVIIDAQSLSPQGDGEFASNRALLDVLSRILDDSARTRRVLKVLVLNHYALSQSQNGLSKATVARPKVAKLIACELQAPVPIPPHSRKTLGPVIERQRELEFRSLKFGS